MILKNGKVFYNRQFHNLDIRVVDNKINEINTHITPLSSELLIDCKEQLILPGMVDIHTHGCLGYDFTVSSDEQIAKMKKYYVSQGTTSVVATVMTGPKSTQKEAISRLSAHIDCSPSPNSSRIVGINLEGPFFNVAQKGAHDENCLLSLDDNYMEELFQLSNNNILLIDIDPTLKNSMDFIKKYKEKSTISLAHTACDYNLALESFAAGAKHITHLFNAMKGLHHREPGMIGAFYDSNANAEVICDGFHIHPAVIRLMFKACGNRIVLISDSISATGLPDGKYVSGGLDIFVEDGKAKLSSGTIAGSTISLLDGVKNAISFGITPEVAIHSATELAAKSVGIDEKVGSIEVNKYADLLILSADWNLETVMINGTFV